MLGGGGGWTKRMLDASTYPSGPPFSETKVSTLVVWVLVTRRAAWIVSFSTTCTPRPRACVDAATDTAAYRFAGPSALTAVDGRMAPTRTTGLSDRTTWLRKNAVSSMVSVP